MCVYATYHTRKVHFVQLSTEVLLHEQAGSPWSDQSCVCVCIYRIKVHFVSGN